MVHTKIIHSIAFVAPYTISETFSNSAVFFFRRGPRIVLSFFSDVDHPPQIFAFSFGYLALQLSCAAGHSVLFLLLLLILGGLSLSTRSLYPPWSPRSHHRCKSFRSSARMRAPWFLHAFILHLLWDSFLPFCWLCPLDQPLQKSRFAAVTSMDGRNRWGLYNLTRSRMKWITLCCQGCLCPNRISLTSTLSGRRTNSHLLIKPLIELL